MAKGIAAALAGMLVVAAFAVGGAALLLGGGAEVATDAAASPAGTPGAGEPAAPGPTRSPSSEASASPSSPSSPSSPASSAPSSPASSGTAAAGPPDAAALAELRRILRADDAVARTRLAGSWVAQLDAAPKGVGERAVAALRRHRELRRTYPAAVLVDAQRWSDDAADRYWVTLLARPFPTAETPLAWCHTQGLTPNHCFARQLLTDGSWDSNIVLWPG